MLSLAPSPTQILYETAATRVGRLDCLDGYEAFRVLRKLDGLVFESAPLGRSEFEAVMHTRMQGLFAVEGRVCGAGANFWETL